VELTPTGTGIRFDKEDQLAMDRIHGPQDEERMTFTEAYHQLVINFASLLNAVGAVEGGKELLAYMNERPEVL
jgi:hypothetical protein